MATDSKPTETAEGSWSPRRDHGSQKITETGGKDAVAPAPSTDPDVLAAQIERTREDLAETLDAIADKVSPKRVAHRTTESAKEAVAEKTALVKEKAAEATETVKEKAAEATENVKEAAASLKEKVQHRSDDLDGAAIAPATTTGSLADATDRRQVTLEPAGSEMLPVTTSRPVAHTSSRAPVLAGAAAAVLVVLFILRRRRS